MATTTRKAAPHAESNRAVETIATADQNKTMTRVLELALGQIDDLDVALAAFQEEV